MGEIFDADHSRQGHRWSRSWRAEVWPPPSTRRTVQNVLTQAFFVLLLLYFSCRSMLSPLYMAEISPPETRGSLLALEQFSIVLGCVIGFWTGFLTRNGKPVPRFWLWNPGRLNCRLRVLQCRGACLGEYLWGYNFFLVSCLVWGHSRCLRLHVSLSFKAEERRLWSLSLNYAFVPVLRLDQTH